MMYKNFLKRFINEYKSHECIWKVKSNDYTNKQKKEEAYKGLQTILKETNPSATVDDVKRKINSLRSCFRKEFRRVAQSKSKASETDTIYKPSLWYYDLLLFLKDQEVPQAIIINDDEDNILDFNETEIKHESEDEDQLSEPSVRSSPVPKVQVAPAKRKLRKESEKLLRVVCERLQNEDEDDIVGKCVANKLRKLDPTMKVYAEKLITDVLYHAQLGMLNHECFLTNPQFK